MDKRIYWAIIIVLVIVIVILVTLRGDLTGVWVAHPDFLASADLKKMVLYLSTGLFNRSGYLYVENADGIIEDKKIEMRIIPTFGAAFVTCNADLWPEKMRMKRKNNSITLWSGETLYAVLYKDSILSDV